MVINQKRREFMKFNKKDTLEIMKLIVFTLIGIFILYNITTIWNIVLDVVDIMSPFILGAAIAFIINLVMNAFEKRMLKKIKNTSWKRAMAIVMSICLLVLVMVFVLFLIIPEVVAIARELISNMPSYVAFLQDKALELTKTLPEINDYIENINIDNSSIRDSLITLSTNIITVTGNTIIGFFTSFFDVIVAFVFSIYLLFNKEKIKRYTKRVIYAYIKRDRADYIVDIYRLSRDTFRRFLVGQTKEAVILGCLCFFGMLIFDLPYKGSISTLVGITAFIPVFGAWIGGIVGALLILSVSPIKALIFIIFIIVLQQLEGQLIYPRVVGKSINMPSILVMVAITVGGGLFGILGMLIGLPVVAILFTIFNNSVERRSTQKDGV